MYRQKQRIYNLKNYLVSNNENGKPDIEYIEDECKEICEILKNNKGYHLRLKKEDDIVLFGDLDNYKKDIEEFKKEIKIFFEEKYNLCINIEKDFLYTQNFSKDKDGKSFHYSIPKYYGKIYNIKKIMLEFKKKYGYHREIDTSIYSDKWWRLPYQLKENKENTEHRIIKGEMQDFIVTYITEESINIDKIIIDNEDNDSILSDITTDNIIKDNIFLSKWDLNSVINEEEYNNELKEKGDLIDMKFINSYNDWTKIIWSLKSDNIKNRELALYITKKSPKFKDEEYFYKIWNFYKKEDLTITIGTFNYYAKISNPDEYLKIKAKFNNKSINNVLKMPTQENIAKCFYNICGEDFLYNNEEYYYFNGIIWEKSRTAIRRKFVGDFTKIFLNYQIDLLKKISETTPDSEEYISINEKNKHLTKIIIQLQTNKNIKDICNDSIKVYIENNDIEFEKKPNIFCFNNAVYDLDKCEFLKVPNKFDYMNITTGYDYRCPIKEEIEEVNKMLDKIFRIKDERELYLIILATGLYGQTLEKFILANGEGRNGKGVLNEFVQHMIGYYGYTCSNSILLNSINNGANQSIANMNNKRLIFYREPEVKGDVQLNSSIIKEITGGNEINARGLFSSNTKTKLKGTHILECNTKPRMNGETDQSMQMRLIDVLFRSTFTKIVEDVNENNNIFLGDDTYKSDLFKDKYRYALFHIIIEHWKKYLDKKKNIEFFIPESIRDRSNEYLKNSNEIYTWFEETYENNNDNTIILKLEDVFEAFKESNIYNEYTKKEKRECNKKCFIDKLSKNVFIKKYYKERERRVEVVNKYNVSEIKNVLICYNKKC
jgi:phage/plasmid-associated DNA primase